MNINRRRTVLYRAVRCESLEPRMLLSLAPAGAEFRVNTFTTNAQQAPAVASDADGDFVVVWDGNGSGDGNGVFAQRYNAAGVAQGAEFLVNSSTSNPQRDATVAMDADGDFVVAWESLVVTGNYDIFAQRYNAAGVPQGGEFRANTFTTSNQDDASIAMDASGNFVISWMSFGQQSANSRGIYAQRYSALGAAQGGELHVNAATTTNHRDPTVAMDANGDFVVVWASDASGITAQRFNSAGATVGPEFNVNTSTTTNGSRPTVAMDASGDFVVIWNGTHVWARRFDSGGVAQGAPFAAATFTTGFPVFTGVAMDADGDFLVTWERDGPDGSSYGIFAQSFNAPGVPQGSEFRVNTFTTNRQRIPAVTMDADGDAVIAWNSLFQDNPTSYGVYAQRYGESNPDTAAPMIGGVFATQASLVLSFSEQMSVTGGSSGPNSATNKANYRLTRNGVDISSQINFVTFGLNTTTRKLETTLFFSSALSNGSYVVTARDTLRDTSINALDGNFDGVAGGDFAQAFSIIFPVPVGPEFRVNTFTTGDQRSPKSAADANGDFVVAWQSRAQDGDGEFQSNVYAQRYNVAGVAQGSEFRVNDFTTGSQFLSSVAMDDDGDFVVAWGGAGPSDSAGVFARRFNAAGVPQGVGFRVSETTGFREFPSVAMAANGSFVVAWESHRSNPTGYEVYARRFSAAGVAQGGEFRVDQTTAPTKKFPVVAADADGDFLVTWSAPNQDGDDLGIYARRFNAAGAPLSNEFLVNTTTAGRQSAPLVAMDADGDAVVAWKSGAAGGPVYDLFAQRYDRAGAAQGGEFQVNQTTLSQFSRAPSVAMDDGGDFVVAWDRGDVFARRFNAAGVPQSGEFLVNTFTNDIQESPSVTTDADGDRFVIAWTSRGFPTPQDGSGYGVFAQRYARVTEVNISNFVFQAPPHRLQFTFNDDVAASLGTNDLVLENLTTSTTIPSVDLSISYDSVTNTATFSYTGNAGGFTGVLQDGNYRATLLASGINALDGTPMAANHIFTFFFLNGDANRDGAVNLTDFNTLASNFGSSGRVFSQGNFDYDPAGTVNLADFNILASRFGNSVSPQSSFGRQMIRSDDGELGIVLEELS